MRLTKAKRRYGVHVGISPLIDVVFLLIIFFMTFSQLQKMEVEVIELPEAKAAKDAETADQQGQLIVNVKVDGSVVVEGKLLTAESLEVILKSRDINASVLVRADRELAWEKASGVLALCRELGIRRVRVAVQEAQ
jgi:biopolymer transport protein ExbD